MTHQTVRETVTGCHEWDIGSVVGGKCEWKMVSNTNCLEKEAARSALGRWNNGWRYIVAVKVGAEIEEI